jgi:hypothetical protein
VLPVVRRGFVYLLLAIVPFGGLRVVCVDDPARSTSGAARASRADCALSCALRAAPGSGTKCALGVSNPQLMFVAFDALAPSAVPVLELWRASHTYPEPRTFFDEPALALIVPPPEA